MASDPAPPVGSSTADGLAGRIAGLPILKGLLLYGAVLTFAGLYAYFIDKVLSATTGTKPELDTAMVSAAAALAGVLGSAFALVIGTPPPSTNDDLATRLKRLSDTTRTIPRGERVRTRLRQILSFEPGGEKQHSWPLTFGIWAYAAVGSGVAATYILDQGESPPEFKALAIAFAGYVLAFVTAVYKTS